MADLIVVAVIAAVGFLVLMAQALRPKKIADSVERDSAKWGLAITTEVRPILLRRRRASGLGYAIGTPVGLVGSFGILTLVLHQHYSLASGLIPQISWLVTGGLGALAGGVIGARSVRIPGRRIARDHAVTVEDYVDPVERRAAWIIAAIALAIGLVDLIHGGRGPDALIAATAGFGALAVIAGAALVSRLIVARPQRADTTVLLAWDDALRAATLRSITRSATVIALLSLVGTLPIAVASTGIRVDRDGMQLGTVWALVAVLLVGWIWGERQRPARYFLRRLWPGTAAEADANERAAMEVQP